MTAFVKKAMLLLVLGPLVGHNVCLEGVKQRTKAQTTRSTSKTKKCPRCGRLSSRKKRRTSKVTKLSFAEQWAKVEGCIHEFEQQGDEADQISDLWGTLEEDLARAVLGRDESSAEDSSGELDADDKQNGGENIERNWRHVFNRIFGIIRENIIVDTLTIRDIVIIAVLFCYVSPDVFTTSKLLSDFAVSCIMTVITAQSTDEQFSLSDFLLQSLTSIRNRYFVRMTVKPLVEHIKTMLVLLVENLKLYSS